jgi:hypothetical protein
LDGWKERLGEHSPPWIRDCVPPLLCLHDRTTRSSTAASRHVDCPTQGWLKT